MVSKIHSSIHAYYVILEMFQQNLAVNCDTNW